MSHDTQHDGPDSPRTGGELGAQATTALVLSSGGPRGFVHVGVLKALDELQITPKLIVGASVGSLVAALYAAGHTAAQIEELALSLVPTSLTRFAIGAEEKLSSTVIYEFMRRHCKNALIEQCTKAKLAIAVAKRGSGEVALFTQGNLAVAVQASCAIERTFTPVNIRGTVYVDPDLHAPLPVRAARTIGALRVLAVDASAHESKAPTAAERFRQSDLAKRRLTQPDSESANVNLHPEFGYWVNMSEQFRRQAIQAGYVSTMTKAAQIRELFHVG